VASNNKVDHKDVVWIGKPWVVPALIIRTITVFLIFVLFFLLQMFAGVAFLSLYVLPLWVWTLVVFVLIWLVSMLELVVFYYSNTYTLRQDGLEIRHGIIRLHSFVVTPSGFGDLLVYQSIGGRIFGYGDITVNSQGERQTKLSLVRDPFKNADTIRDIMGKPIVRVENHV